MTATAGNVLTAALWNANVRDNFLETAPAKATTAGSIFVATGANAIAQRIPQADAVATSETTGSTTYAALATFGPSVTVTSGTTAIVMFGCHLQNDTSASRSYCSYAVSGNTTSASSDARAIWYQASAVAAQSRIGNSYLHTGLTAGVGNIFALQYRVSGNTGTFVNRSIAVIPL